MTTKRLVNQQLSDKLINLQILKTVQVPRDGWVRTIRKALGMTMVQLGKRLGITPQSAMEIERREKEGSITIKSLREVARAMDMELVYGFVPIDGSLDALINRKARELATKIVNRTSHSMHLESQGNSKVRITKAIEERAEIIKQQMPKSLWD
jgi:predicted DNA-binding mobile mystery protein A